MLFQIALLALVFLGERLTVRGVMGMVVAGLGTLIVQLRPAAVSARHNEVQTGVVHRPSRQDRQKVERL